MPNQQAATAAAPRKLHEDVAKELKVLYQSRSLWRCEGDRDAEHRLSWRSGTGLHLCQVESVLAAMGAAALSPVMHTTPWGSSLHDGHILALLAVQRTIDRDCGGLDEVRRGVWAFMRNPCELVFACCGTGVYDHEDRTDHLLSVLMSFIWVISKARKVKLSEP